MKKIIIVLMGCVLVLVGVLFLLFNNKDKNKDNKEIVKADFNSKLIDVINKENSDNYLISPYSIEMALRMLSEGTDTTTYKEIDDLIGKREMPTFASEKRISVANALFLRDKYKDIIKDNFVNTLKQKYDAEVLIDKYKTPDKINNWVSKKTYKMIDKIIDTVDKDFVLGLANALVINLEWKHQFECDSTSAYKFNNGEKTYDVEMMHNEFRSDIKYLNDKDIKGIILPYFVYDDKGEINYDEEGIALEFIGLMPNDINKFLNEFTTKGFDEITNSFKSVQAKEKVNLAIPRFKYDYSLDLMGVLKILGVSEIFSSYADFTRIFGEIGDLYISDAIHKTHIELNETGTKAAAVTYFGMKASAMIEDNKVIDITFDKPFVYVIRDTKTKEMLFFGVVYNPTAWTKTTCNGGK